jgi:hypothetical protein
MKSLLLRSDQTGERLEMIYLSEGSVKAQCEGLERKSTGKINRVYPKNNSCLKES